jgi:hypothetical protein
MDSDEHDIALHAHRVIHIATEKVERDELLAAPIRWKCTGH